VEVVESDEDCAAPRIQVVVENWEVDGACNGPDEHVVHQDLEEGKLDDHCLASSFASLEDNYPYEPTCNDVLLQDDLVVGSLDEKHQTPQYPMMVHEEEKDQYDHVDNHLHHHGHGRPDHQEPHVVDHNN
jgi:hypothetical protein